MSDRPLVLSLPPAPHAAADPVADRLAELHAKYNVVETTDEDLPSLPDEVLGQARYIIGQPPLDHALMARLASLRCIFNVESNLLPNMPYDVAFARGIHVVTTGAVFAQPVAEIGWVSRCPCCATSTGRMPISAGRELWGGDGNAQARLLTGAEVGIIGLGDLAGGGAGAARVPAAAIGL